MKGAEIGSDPTRSPVRLGTEGLQVLHEGSIGIAGRKCFKPYLYALDPSCKERIGGQGSRAASVAQVYGGRKAGCRRCEF